MIRTDDITRVIRKLESEMPLKFPINITPDLPLEILPPFLRRIVMEVFQLTMAPTSSIFCGAMCALAASVQGLYLVQKSTHQISPLGLAFIVSLDSGERKSSSLAPLFSGLYEFDKEALESDSVRLRALRVQLEAWESGKSGRLNGIKKLAKSGEDTSQLIEQLMLHELKRPKAQRKLRCIFEKTSIAALVGHMFENIPCTALITDEAMTVFSGSSSQDFGMLNKLLDGASFRSDTFHNAMNIESPSFTFGVWGQAQVVNEYLKSNNNSARATGFIARCFVIRPVPTSGSRYLGPHDEVKNTEALDLFNRFCKQCLVKTRESFRNDSNRKVALRFSQSANDLWCNYYNGIEYKIGNNPELQPYRDLASKQADKVARIAALIHCIESDGELISGEAMQYAINIGDWLFNQTIFYFRNTQFEQMSNLAMELYNWIAEHLRITGQNYVSRTVIMQFGPSNFRSKVNLNPAIELLRCWGRIWTGSLPGKGRTTYVGLTPAAQQFPRQ